MKMDGAKHITDTSPALFLRVRVGRRLFCVEVFARASMEREGMRIVVLVRSEQPENGWRRKSKVSLAISFNQGLVGA